MCDTLCVRTGDAMLFAKNSDRHPAEAQIVEWHDARPAVRALRTQYLEIPDLGASAYLGSRPTWLRGAEHGVNEHHVAIGNEKIFTVDSPRDLPPALLGMDLVRLGLERARCADDALDVITSLLTQYGQGGSGEPFTDEPYFSSFLIADPEAGWVIETSNRTWVARPAGDGCAISNRVSLRTDWTRSSPTLRPALISTRSDSFACQRRSLITGSPSPAQPRAAVPRRRRPTSRRHCAHTEVRGTTVACRARRVTTGRASRCACTGPSSTRRRQQE